MPLERSDYESWAKHLVNDHVRTIIVADIGLFFDHRENATRNAMYRLTQLHFFIGDDHPDENGLIQRLDQHNLLKTV